MKKQLLTYLFFLITLNISVAQISTENLQGWFIGDSVILTSDYVSQWTDYSGNDFHLTQNTSANRPAKIENALNTHATISFDGSNDYMDCSTNLLPTNALFTYFFVCKNTKTTISTLFSQYSGGQVGRTLTVFNFQDANRCTHLTLPGGSTLFSFSSNNYFLLSCSNSATTNGLQLFQNGTFKIQGTATAIQNINSQIGGQQFANYFGGEIAEIIIYNSQLDESQRQNVEDYLMNKYSPILDLGENIIVDYGFCDTALVIDESFTDILWSTGETNDSIYVNESGQYWVQAEDIFGRIQYDTINAQFPIPDISNSNICLGDSILYVPDLVGSYSYIWSDLTTDASKYYKDEGDYWLRIEDDNFCFDTVFFSVDVDSFKNEIWLGNDTSLCSGNTIQLINGEELCTSFIWTPGGSTEPFQTVNTTGWQKIEVENDNGCIASDSIYVTIVGTAPTPGYIVENFCFGDTTQFIDNSTPPGDISSWQWIINENDTLYTQNAEWVFETTGDQHITLVVESFSGCENSIEIEIEILEKPIISFINNPACSGTSLEFVPDYILPSGTNISSFSWYINNSLTSNSEVLNHTFSISNNYNVLLQIEADNGCTGTFEQNIIVEDEYPLPTNLSLILPTNNNVNNNTNQHFVWNQADNSIKYKLQIASDIVFSEIIFEISDLSQSDFYYNFEENYDTVFWKVLAYNPCDEYTISEINQFSFFHPDSLLNLKTWLSADSGVISNDTLVDQWQDRSTNDNSLLQSVESNKPLLINNSINGLPVIRFDGINDYMDFDTSILRIDGVFSYFFICRNTKTTTNSTIFTQYLSGQNGRTLLAFNFSGIGNVTHITIPGTSSTQSFLTDDYALISATNNGLNDGLKLYLNSSIETIGSGVSTLDVNSQIGGQQFGYYFQGDIAEIICYDTVLNNYDRQLVYQYLRHKYAPPVNLSYDIHVPYGFCDTTITTAEKEWFTDYLWSTGETDSVIHVNQAGEYSVTVTDIFGFTSEDDIQVFYPKVELQEPITAICTGDTLLWDSGLSDTDYSFNWFNSTSTSSMAEYWTNTQAAVEITDTIGCKFISDTILVELDYFEDNAALGDGDTSLCIGNILLLSSNAEEAISYLWQDGITTPGHLVDAAGEYSITVTNALGCTARDTINVNILGTVPVPDFSQNGHCAENSVEFQDLSTSVDGTINDWQWSYNGETFATSTNSNYTFDTAGIYPVSLEIFTDVGCHHIITKDVQIHPLPIIGFSPANSCNDNITSFVNLSSIPDGSIDNYLWSFGDGNSSSEISPLHTYTDAGIYNLTLLATSNMSCENTLEQNFEVKASPQSNFTASPACYGEPILFWNTTINTAISPAISYLWDFGDESISTESDPQHTYTDNGEYFVKMIAAGLNGCHDTITKSITVNANPEAKVENLSACINIPHQIMDASTIEDGEINKWEWEIDTLEFTVENPQHTFTDTGSISVHLKVESAAGCSSETDTTLHIYTNPIAMFTLPQDWGAVPLSIEMENSSEDASLYYWDFGDGETSTIPAPEHIWQDSGNYSILLRVTSDNGCVDTISKNLRVIIPHTDVAVIAVRPYMDGNYLIVEADIINPGTVPIYNLALDLNPGNGEILREVMSGLFQEGSVMTYLFNTQQYISSGELPEYVCVHLDPTDEDETPENNDLCSIKDASFKIYNLWPNPVEDNMNFSILIPETDDLQIEVYDATGRRLIDNLISIDSGYHQLTLDCSDISNGKYQLRLTYGDEVLVSSFIVSKL